MPVASTAAVPVGSLTDAELAVLARPRSRVGPVPAMPVWSRLDPGRRASTARDARAALVARRLLDPGARSRAELRRDLRSVLVLRETATGVVAVARATSRGRDHWYAHATGDVVLLEQVSGDGVHRFALTAAATLPTLAVAAVLHPDARATSTATPDAQTAWLRADVELRGATHTRREAWVSGPGGTWRVSPGPHPTAEPVGPDQVRRELGAALAVLAAPAVPDER
jgi:hypothetical protein